MNKKSIINVTLFGILAFTPICASADGLGNEASEQNTPDGWTAVQLPQLPEITSSNTFNITTYGASTTSSDNTTAIQAALNAVPSTGGEVVIPEGTFLCGPIKIKSKTILHFNDGAELELLPYGTYPPITAGGISYDNFINCVDNATDIVIEGKGTIEGQGTEWWRAYENNSSISRGAVIRFKKGSRFLIKDITVQNAPGVNITIGMSGNANNATIHDVTIKEPSSSDATNPSHNTDGISMWGPYINIYNCNISNGDDNVVADSYSHHIHVWNCTFGTGHGASIGSYTSNGVGNIIYEGCSFTNTDSGFRLKSQRGRSGDVGNITFRNCTMTGVGNPVYIECWYDRGTKPSPDTVKVATVTSTTPAYHDILIQNVTSTGTVYNSSKKANFPIYIYGLPESYVKSVTFDNVQISAQKGMFLAFCEVNFINGCKISNTKSSTVFETKYDATVTGKYDGSDTSGINVIDQTNSTVKKIDYYDTSGRNVSNNTLGLLVKKTTFEDGTTSTMKFINK